MKAYHHSKNLAILATALLVTSCQTRNAGVVRPQIPAAGNSVKNNSINNKAPGSPLETRDYILVEDADKDSAESSATNGNSSAPSNSQSSVANQDNSTVALAKLPKIGLILGPGGAKAFAHIGVLQEFQKAKIPIHAVAGLEFASPMAALFAWKGYVNDVEWQMFKIKDDEIIKKGLISSTLRPAEMTDIRDFIKVVFQKLKVEDLKKPFACPALNLSKNQIYLMSRGNLDQLLPYCWPYPPMFKPYRNNVSGLRELKLTSDYLRSQGAQYVVLVNVLGGNIQKKPVLGSDSLENMLWTELATSYARPQAGIDAMIALNLEDYGIMDLSLKREIMQKGAEQSYKQIEVLAQRLGF